MEQASSAVAQDSAADQLVSDQELNPPEPCPWCDDFTYGLAGFQPETNQGVMCNSCKEQRASVNRCRGHHTAPLDGLNSESFDFKAAYDTLCPGFSTVRVDRNKWCSLCPTPALFQCATQAAAGAGKEAGGPGPACGLLLCEPCNILLQIFKNVALVVAKNKVEDPVDGARADVGFLLPGSCI
ncbi:putative C6 finger domain protein [Aspergillus undulatus]|uniref:putative C6 finger domain protein n=1 Tax=Aspergillus undulatus TaxID=1810928 RepID=UPI003CCDDAA8